MRPNIRPAATEPTDECDSRTQTWVKNGRDGRHPAHAAQFFPLLELQISIS